MKPKGFRRYLPGIRTRLSSVLGSSACGSAATRRAGRAKDLAKLNGDCGTQFAVLNSNCAPDRLRWLSVDADECPPHVFRVTKADRLRATHLTGSAVDSRRHLAREGSLPAWAETFLKGSGSSMELEPGPEDAPKVAHAQSNLSVLPRKNSPACAGNLALNGGLSINACLWRCF
jgi:hypothetical protein